MYGEDVEVGVGCTAGDGDDCGIGGVSELAETGCHIHAVKVEDEYRADFDVLEGGEDYSAVGVGHA